MITARLFRGAVALAAAAALALGASTLATAAPTTAAPTTAAPAKGAPAKSAPEPVLPISSDGTITTAAELAALPRRTAVPARPGTGPSTKDGSVHGGDAFGQTLGEVGINAIIGADDRYRTTPTNWWPPTATVQLTRLINGVRTQYCTGWMISASTLVTAGHCVYNGGWFSGQGVLVYPGRDAGSTPFGSCGAVSFHSNTAWVNNRNPEYDFGAIKLNCTVGNSTGTYGFFWQSASLTGTPTYLRGYPCDKPYGEQWASYDQIRSTSTRLLYYQNDTWNCHSGSPVYTYSSSFCSGPCAAAIHAYGGSTNNYGPRITQEVFNFLLSWM